MKTFSLGGVHPNDSKISANAAIENFPIPEVAYISMGQHLGAPAEPIVAAGDKVKVNIPLAIIKLCIDAGMELPNINGKNSLKNIDFNQVFMLVNAGVIGKLVEVESADGDTVSITVE